MLTLTMAGANVIAPPMPDLTDPSVQVWRDYDGTVCAYGHTVGGDHWMHVPGVGSFRFTSRADEVTAIAQPAALTDVIVDVYRRSVLPMALQALGQEVLHASAVLTPAGVVALCAESGTGKSTTAFGLGLRGHALWADDAVAFEVAERSILALPLPFEMRLLAEAASFFDHHRVAAVPASGREIAERPRSGPAPLAALCVLKRTPGGPEGRGLEVVRRSAVGAFLAVLPHAYCFSLHDLDRKRRMMEQYLDLTARVPVFEVRFQAGLDALEAVLDGIEREVIGAVAAPALGR